MEIKNYLEERKGTKQFISGKIGIDQVSPQEKQADEILLWQRIY